MNRLSYKQTLHITMQQAWAFFSNPKNLARITPSHLNFQILSQLPDQIYEGLIIAYHITPFLGVKMHWVTEIKYVQRPFSFVDEQRLGPYQFWFHRHTFREISDGVLMEDEIHYSLKWDFLGEIINELMVKKQLQEIFEFRRHILEQNIENFFKKD